MRRILFVLFCMTVAGATLQAGVIDFSGAAFTIFQTPGIKVGGVTFSYSDDPFGSGPTGAFAGVGPTIDPPRGGIIGFNYPFGMLTIDLSTWGTATSLDFDFAVSPATDEDDNATGWLLADVTQFGVNTPQQILITHVDAVDPLSSIWDNSIPNLHSAHFSSSLNPLITGQITKVDLLFDLSATADPAFFQMAQVNVGGIMATPEPASMFLMGSALFAAIGYRLRRKSR